jgi:hypothetical protein
MSIEHPKTLQDVRLTSIWMVLPVPSKHSTSARRGMVPSGILFDGTNSTRGGEREKKGKTRPFDNGDYLTSAHFLQLVCGIFPERKLFILQLNEEAPANSNVQSAKIDPL